MKSFENDHGLLLDPSTAPPTCCGYLVDFGDHGAFAPDGRVPASADEIATHNHLLAEAEWQNMLTHGRGLLYLTRKAGQWAVSDWPGTHRISTCSVRTSFHNFAGRNGRRDVWFTLDRSRWHGVNIGDNSMLRVRRLKKGG